MNTFFQWLQIVNCVGGGALALCVAASATDYYVATTGSDEAAGSQEAPFRTIQRAAEVMQAGDTCIVREGVYRETVRPANSGSADQPITFRAAEGESVVVSGADPIEGWNSQDGPWTAQTDWTFDQLFVDGVMMPPARWPNMDAGAIWPTFAEADDGSDAAGIVDGDLSEVDLRGARIHVLPGRRWVSWTRPVDGMESHDTARKVLFQGSWSQEPAYRIEKGTQYYLFGAPSLLDAPGEWCVDGSTVTLIPPAEAAPDHLRIEARKRELAFDLRERSHIVVEGFRIFAATVHLGEAQSCAINDCHIRYPSHFTNPDGWTIPDSGIVVSGRDNIIQNSSVQYSAGNGITLDGENNTVENCLVRYVNYMATDCGAIFARGRGNVIERNTLCDTGRSVLLHRTLKAGRIEYNDIFNAGLLTTDLGSTYCYNTDGEGTVIAYNWVHDNQADHVGVGIYIDNGSKNFVIHHNVSWNNPDSGIRLNTPSTNNLVYNNTVLDNGNSLSYWGPDGEKRQPGCRAINNIFTDKVELGEGIELSHNYEGMEPGIGPIEAHDFQLEEGSSCIDAGTHVDGITDGYTGAAPDIGACEYGRPSWKPGHDWGEPPEF